MGFLVAILLAAALDAPAGAEASTDTVRTALAYLTSSVGSPDPEVRLLAVQAWGELGNRSASRLLRRALRDDDPYVRIEAAYSLHRLGDDAGFDALAAMVLASSAAVLGVSTGTSAAPSPDRALLEVSFNKVRARAVERLADIGGEKAVEIFEATLEDPADAVRDATAVSLARLGFTELEGVFVDTLKDPKDSVRAASARALGRLGRPVGIAELTAATTDQSAVVRAEAFRALGEQRSFKHFEVLSRGLKDKDVQARAAAIEGLGRIRTDAARKLLQEAALDKDNPALALKAAQGLARRGEAVDLTLADRALISRDPDLPLQAVEILRSVVDERSTERLRGVLYGEHEPRARVLAAQALIQRLSPRRRRSP